MIFGGGYDRFDETSFLGGDVITYDWCVLFRWNFRRCYEISVMSDMYFRVYMEGVRSYFS
jgi:hypothetical protein